jgi:hypothetical protein
MLARLGAKLEPKDTAPRILLDCAEASAAARVRVCSGGIAASLVSCLVDGMHCNHGNRAWIQCAEDIVARIYAGYCSRIQV